MLLAFCAEGFALQCYSLCYSNCVCIIVYILYVCTHIGVCTYIGVCDSGCRLCVYMTQLVIVIDKNHKWGWVNNSVVFLLCTYYLSFTSPLYHRCGQVALPVPGAPPDSRSLELPIPPAECQWPGRDPAELTICRCLSGCESGGVAAEWPGHMERSGGGCVQASWWGTPGPCQRHCQELQE